VTLLLKLLSHEIVQPIARSVQNDVRSSAWGDNNRKPEHAALVSGALTSGAG
jgi:hypothetical protein